MTIKFVLTGSGDPVGKLADVELHFSRGPLAGLRLIGFGVWERVTGKRQVSFPARHYSRHGDLRTAALLRPQADYDDRAQDRLRDRILCAFRDYERALAEGRPA